MNDEQFKRLESEVVHLRQLIHLQKAVIEGLKTYTVSRISEIAKVDRQKESAAVERLIMIAYDQHISELENSFPALAAEIDMRSKLPDAGQDKWYFPSEQPPKKDEPPK
ncbi:hypothetical protein [Pedosphaera parvula]|uniref:Uncharacterized protein n=1 Tax=Pedosphaera parvula (strain Ellin514) TaxID=320771 RepID=B9XEE6_PEDPL|nr:hypothetical protein [Pedosphaera parvula]EEF61660.1 hypothetical protein Cflav_PD4700 [Pedosphaera parvula Ellin514]